MKCLAYVSPAPGKDGKDYCVTTIVSPRWIKEHFYPDYRKRVLEKHGVDPTFEDCYWDFMVVHWAWEVEDKIKYE